MPEAMNLAEIEKYLYDGVDEKDIPDLSISDEDDYEAIMACGGCLAVNKAFLESKQTEFAEGWIGIDLDGVLAKSEGAYDPAVIGEPIPAMILKVRRWLSEGKNVKIFSARASDKKAVEVIKEWLSENGLPEMEITNQKDKDMRAMYDDKAVSVKKNTGIYHRAYGK